MPIQLLPPMLANQIAAGEVVERPASVVKELVENSIDAGSTHIDIDIEKGGHKRIRIRDNGSGIEKEQLTLALSRHATSKIANFDDLNNILSLGFRGEALASISSVSRLTLTSKPATQEHAWQAYCEGRDMEVKIEPAAHPDGTTIDVLDLFYNTPARRKFLRTEKTEFQHIEEVVKRIALSNPQISIILRHNDNVVRRYVTKGRGGYAQRVAAVLGQKFVNSARCVEVQHDSIHIQAWLGDETMMRSTSDIQFSFVNGRGMRDKLIHHAVRQAYELQWGVLEQPAFVIYLSIPPDEVDVNVHPAKHEVRFHQSRLVHDFIVNVVSQGLTSESDDHAMPQPVSQHDYIRPLTPNKGIGEHPSLLSPQLSPASQAGSQSAQPSPAPVSSYPSSASSRGGKAGYGATSNGVTKAYHNAFTALHEIANTSADLADGKPKVEFELTCITLNEQQKVFVLGEQLALLDVGQLMPVYLLDLITSSSATQPLMMPIAVDIPSVNHELVESLSAYHFVIDKILNKWRLQQVPSKTRHLPWLALFPALLASEQQDPAGACEDICSEWLQSSEGLNTNLAQQLWDWFNYSSCQQELIEQHALLCPLNKLAELFTHDQ